MQSNLRANIELALQAVIAVAIVAIAGVVISRFLSPTISRTSRARINVGERLDVPGTNWAQNKKTLVFFLMKDCVYCKSSAPLYRDLISEGAKRQVQMLAILPNPLEEGREYVRELNLQIADVRTAPLTSYKVSGTPTVLFVNEKGIVESAWFGAAPERENEMRDTLVALFDR